MSWKRVWILAAAVALAGCGSDDGDEGGADVPADVPAEDVAADTGPEDVEADAPEDVAEPDATEDTAEPDASDVDPDVGPPEPGVPDALPFELTREAAGEPVTQEEIDAFTTAMTSFWKDTQYFRWVRFHSHGIHPGNEDGWPDYAMWWQDTTAHKVGDTVTFSHVGRGDNIEIRTGKVLNVTLAGYLGTADEDMKWVATQYAKGFVAMSMGMEWGEDDPVKYLQPRAIFTRNHGYEMEGGRKVLVDYDPARKPADDWNAATINNTENPYWGDIWIRNQRSKDDVPHIFRTLPMLMRAEAEAEDEAVREAAGAALEYLRGFAKDIVDSGYMIRTKDEDGVPHVPRKPDGTIKDLASFVMWDDFIPEGECTAKLAAALIAYGEPLGHDCGKGDGGEYETIATTTHYFNYAIIRYFHVAAAYNALAHGYYDMGRELLVGLGERMDAILHDEDMPHYGNDEWFADAAALLLISAAAGMPLTDEEARLIQEQYTLSAEHYAEFPSWDPWDASVPDGPFDYKPHRGLEGGGDAVRPPTLGYLLEYCNSPLRNPAGAQVVDCERILDPSAW